MSSKSKTEAPSTAPKGVVEEKGKLEAGFLEEDDEFEEFPVEEWAKADDDEEEEELQIWEDQWDDDIHNDDFAKELQAELSKLDANKAP